MHGAAPPQTHPPSRLGKSCLCGTGAPCVCACRGPQGSLCEGRARAVLRCRTARCRACTARTAAHSCTAHPTAPRGGTLRAEGGVCERMGCCRACQAGGWAAPEGARADVVRASTRVLRRDASQVLARRGAAALRLDLARTSRCGGFKPMRAVWGANPPPGRRTARGGSRGTNEALSESANCLPSCSGGPWERRYALGSAVGCPAPRRAVWGRVCP